MKSPRTDIPIDALRRLWRYDPHTGQVLSLRSGKPLSPILKDKRPGRHKLYRYTLPYEGRNIKVAAHRVAWALHYGAWPEKYIDHMDGDTTNNRIDNLREVKFVDNIRNRAKFRNNTSGETGVRQVASGKWQARICVDYELIDLGLYDTKEEAAAVRRKASAKYGFHKNHGRNART